MSGAPSLGVGQDTPGQRSPRFRPDRETSLQSPLRYFASFEPSVAPFKRVSSLDAVVLASDGITPLLTVADPSRTVVPVGRPAEAGEPRDRFYGEVTVDFSAGPVVPLPVVAPRGRVLAVRTEPSVATHVERDGADNYMLVLEGRTPGRPVQVFYEVDAPQGYFGGPVPEAPMDTLADHVARMPRSVQRRARAFARELGIDRQVSLRDALFALTAHFRAFEEGEQPPTDSGDVYLDLARGGVGICRHRAYGFVVTAQALGIPARFVQNEAHSFVEVELPGRGYMRIDLGGAVGGLSAEGAQERSFYAPPVPDTLPRPAAYERAYEEAAAAGTAGAGGPAGAGGAAPEPTPGQWLPERDLGEDPVASAGNAGAGTSSTMAEARQPLSIVLERGAYQVTRGARLEVSGACRASEGSPVAGLPIEISLSTDARPERLYLGTVVSGADGRFTADVPVPPELPRGTYGLHVLSPGNDVFAPAMAR